MAKKYGEKAQITQEKCLQSLEGAKRLAEHECFDCDEYTPMPEMAEVKGDNTTMEESLRTNFTEYEQFTKEPHKKQEKQKKNNTTTEECFNKHFAYDE